MRAGEGESTVGSRLKREQFKRTKHDSHFSKWLVLIGPTDWEDYSLGKEGAARYRVHNLPSATDPGLYELGIAASSLGLGRELSKFDADGIVVVYLGQADNIRTRLQQYGRSGAHLGNCYSTGNPNEYLEKGYGLFENIFSNEHSIVFRWAPMKTKKDAEKMESNLLNTFDYAWNKGGNGVRRPHDILLKLTETGSASRKLTYVYKKLLPFTQKRVGIKIEGIKPLSPEKAISDSNSNEEKVNFLSGIFKFSRSRPKLVSVSDNYDTEESSPSPICGVLLSNGASCKSSPVPGRKRCDEHKGKKVYGFGSKSKIGTEAHDVLSANPEPASYNGQKYLANADVLKSETANKFQVPDKGKRSGLLSSPSDTTQSSSITCGVALQNGYLCVRAPVPGRKRCEQHKGMRVGKFRVPTSQEQESYLTLKNYLGSDEKTNPRREGQ